MTTQNGAAKAAIPTVGAFEGPQETLALLEVLALGTRQVQAGKVIPAAEVVRRLREATAGRSASRSG